MKAFIKFFSNKLPMSSEEKFHLPCESKKHSYLLMDKRDSNTIVTSRIFKTGTCVLTSGPFVKYTVKLQKDQGEHLLLVSGSWFMST